MARSWSRTRIPDRFWRWLSGLPSIPNDFRHATAELRRNHAVSDVYEPGSTFKLVTYSAALEENVATPEGMVDCGGGQINVVWPHRA